MPLSPVQVTYGVDAPRGPAPPVSATSGSRPGRPARRRRPSGALGPVSSDRTPHARSVPPVGAPLTSLLFSLSQVVPRLGAQRPSSWRLPATDLDAPPAGRCPRLPHGEFNPCPHALFILPVRAPLISLPFSLSPVVPRPGARHSPSGRPPATDLDAPPAGRSPRLPPSRFRGSGALRSSSSWRRAWMPCPRASILAQAGSQAMFSWMRPARGAPHPPPQQGASG